MRTLEGERSLGELGHQSFALFDRQTIVEHNSTFGWRQSEFAHTKENRTSACPRIDKPE